jgi:hypothetical protein
VLNRLPPQARVHLVPHPPEPPSLAQPVPTVPGRRDRETGLTTDDHPTRSQIPLAEVFAKVLDDLHIHTDPVTGVRRRLYSCRHYYATQSLLNGVSPYDVSKNMGNSERMIRMHYDHVLVDLRSGVLTGSDHADGAWLRQMPDWKHQLDAIENDPDDHLTDEYRPGK